MNLTIVNFPKNYLFSFKNGNAKNKRLKKSKIIVLSGISTL